MKQGWFKTLLALSLCAATSVAVHAEEVIIEARVALGLGDFSYFEADGNWQNSSVHTTAPGTTSGVGSRWNTRAGSSVTLSPTLQAGGRYLMFAAFPAPSSQSADMVARIDLVGATLTDLSTNVTLNGEVLETTVFQRAGGSTSWRPIGTLVVNDDVTMPEIKFTHISGDISNATTSRFYSDAYRFVNTAEPCLSGLDVLVTVNGPLAAGQTFVDVPGVHTDATKVTVYADGVQIGQKTADVQGGDVVERVVTSPLIAGQVITVTQHDGSDVESCRPNTGQIVGGGANPPVRVSFSLRMDPLLEGPVGAEGASSSLHLMMLGATGPSAGFGTAPLGGDVLQPGTCWQTVDYDFNFDFSYTWAGTDTGHGTFAILDSIAFSIEDPFDTGPYAIYIDNIMNGTNLIEDFEGAVTNANYLFNAPNFSGSTSGNLLAQPPGTVAPNVSIISNANADTGTNSAFASWQFKDAAQQTWLRLPLQGLGRRNPQVDLAHPISIRFLVLPVGQTEGALQVASIGHRTNAIGENVVLEAPVLKGTGPFTYQWKFNGQDVSTSSTLTLNNVQPASAGHYSVVVSNGTCTTESRGTLTVVEEVLPPTLTYAYSGNTLTLTWADSQAVLEAASVLTGSQNDWSAVDASSPHQVDTSTGVRFFRLRR